MFMNSFVGRCHTPLLMKFRLAIGAPKVCQSLPKVCHWDFKNLVDTLNKVLEYLKVGHFF